MNEYNPKSSEAENFIHDGEIQASLKFAEQNRNNRALIETIIEKAREAKGLSHREALLLLDCELDDLNEKIFKLAA